MAGGLTILFSHGEQDIFHTYPRLMSIRDYMKLLNENWTNISKIPIERQCISILMRCVKMQEGQWHIVYVYVDEEVFTVYARSYDFRKIKYGMPGLQFSS